MLTLVRQEWGLKASDGSELWWNGTDIGRLFIKKEIPRDAEHNWIPWAYVPCKVGEMPTHVVAVDTGHHNAASGHDKFLELESLTLLRMVRGGLRKRNENDTPWTCDHCKFSVYLYHPQFGHPSLCIARITGLGVHFYWIEDLIFDQTFQGVLPHFSDEALYDLLEVFTRAYRTGKEAGYAKAQKDYTEAFVDKRLKKRKLPRQSAIKVWIEPKPIIGNKATIDLDEQGKLRVASADPAVSAVD